jgi:hypothetical protein
VREPTPSSPQAPAPASPRELFGVLAEFDRAERLIDAVKRVREAGFTRIDAHTPFPVEGLADLLGPKDNRVAWLTLVGGVLGIAIGYGMQVYANLAFPIDIGNRPLVATPAFMLITFELMVFFAVAFCIFGMLALNHLPRLHHPLFEIAEFTLASSNRFFLVILSNDPRFTRARATRLLRSLEPARVWAVPHTEEPE